MYSVLFIFIILLTPFSGVCMSYYNPTIISSGELRFKAIPQDDSFSIDMLNIRLKWILYYKYSLISKFSFNHNDLGYILNQLYFSKENDFFSFNIGLLTTPNKNNSLSCSRSLGELIEKGIKRKDMYGISLNLYLDNIRVTNYLLFHFDNKYSKEIDTKINYFKVFAKIKHKKNLYHIGLNVKSKINKDDNYTFISDNDILSNFSTFKTYIAKLRHANTLSIDFIRLNKHFCFQLDLNFTKIKWEKIGIEAYKHYNLTLSYMINGKYNAYNFEDGIVEHPTHNGIFPAMEFILSYSNLKIQSQNNFFMRINNTTKNIINSGISLYFSNNFNLKILYSYEKYYDKIKYGKNLNSCILEFGLSF